MQVISDLHGLYPRNIRDAGETGLIFLLGDIVHHGNELHGKRFRQFMAELADTFEHVVYVPGNHEYYHSDIETIDAYLASDPIEGITFANREVLTFGKRSYACCTFWSEIDRSTVPCITDFSLIEGLTPAKYRRLHRDHVAFLRTEAPEDAVFMTHHAGCHLMNGEHYGSVNQSAFSTEYPDLMARCSRWFNGHTHQNLDVCRGKFVSNCRGHPWEWPVNGFDPNKVFTT